MNLQQFEQIILQNLTPDNAIRAQAEAAFNETKKQPDFCILSLVQLIRQSSHEQVRSLCSVLLRRSVISSDSSLWPLISAQTQQTVKVQLLEALEAEQLNHIRKKLSDAIAEVASTIFEAQGKWDELLPYMFKCTKSPNDGQREAALNIFQQLALDIGESMRPHFPVLKEVLNEGLNDAVMKVRLAAMNATASFLQVLDQPEERAQFQLLTPQMLATISAALNNKQEEDARCAIELFVDLAEIDATFLKPHLPQIVQAMLTISTAGVLDPSTRQLGVEFLVTLGEGRPGMVRKIPKFVESVIPVILNMMLSIDDNADWATSKEEDDVDVTDPDVGEEALDRLAISLGGKQVVPIIFAILPRLLGDADWKKRHTALMAIAIVGEGCKKYLEANLGDIIKNVIPFTQDPHPRVRWAACNAIGQMSTDFGPEFQENFHAQAIPALIHCMSDKSAPRVQSHAAAAIINFCEGATAEILGPYLDAMVAKLLGLLQEGQTLVQEQTVTAIAAVADCIEGNFIKYYDAVMPYLKAILGNANSQEYRMLKGKAMECISLIGVAVGKEKFYQDAKDVMELMVKTQSAHLEPDDPQVSFLLQAWARICRCMGQDFVPYLQFVMPPLLASARRSPDIKITDADQESNLPEGWEFIPIGDKRIGINTSTLEEKSTACNMLYCYASDLKEGFFPYVDEVTKLLVPLMKFYYHDGVRQAATTTMPHLLSSAQLYLIKSGAAKGADLTYIRNQFNFMFPTFLESLKDEPDHEILMDGIEALTSCMKIVGDNALSNEQLQTLVEVLLRLFKDVQDRKHDRLSRKKEEDHDEEEEEKIEDEEQNDQSIVSQVSELIGVLARFYKQTFPPLFQSFIMPLVVEMMKPTSPAADRQAALCIFDDIIEHLGANSLAFLQHFYPLAIQYVGDEEPSVRQAAVYGMGLIMECGGDQVKSVVSDVLSRLSQAILLPNARDETYRLATDNAIAAVGKLIKFQAANIDYPQTFAMWLSFLPVTADKIESKVTYPLLCEFVESNNPNVFGANYANLPKILSVFAQVLGTELIDDAITQRIVNILKGMSASSPEIIQSAFAQLPIEQQNKLKQTFGN